jgi:hypothetical protein
VRLEEVSPSGFVALGFLRDGLDLVGNIGKSLEICPAFVDLARFRRISSAEYLISLISPAALASCNRTV